MVSIEPSALQLRAARHQRGNEAVGRSSTTMHSQSGEARAGERVAEQLRLVHVGHRLREKVEDAWQQRLLARDQ
jgi:plasmid stability protein